MKAPTNRTKTLGKRIRRLKSSDPVEVSARIRSLNSDDDDCCVQIMDSSTLQLKGPPPDYQTTNCQFSDVFGEVINQKILFDNVARPMVDDLLSGKNGLLFTYGVTNSGKTYTMTGTVEEPGVLPRCLDMIFNSIKDYQTSKYIFLPDGKNGFQIQTEADALQKRLDRDILSALSNGQTHRKYRPKDADIRYDLEHCQSKDVKIDHRYAVFVSYIEIYNDTVHDLLGEASLDKFGRPKSAQSIRLIQDKSDNMYTSGCIEVEVKNTEEAFSVLQQGQEKKRIASSLLNNESSRSHSILNIRLVQAPMDDLGEDLLIDPSLVKISQLSLVDLAGSERLSRTGYNKGKRLNEASNINCSLMTLRLCLEQLRSNQQNGTNELVKYRNSKLTHLFKSFFEGYGKVKMLVCINPGIKEYYENLRVVQFAEVASSVEVPKYEERRNKHVIRTPQSVTKRYPKPYPRLGSKYISSQDSDSSCKQSTPATPTSDEVVANWKGLQFPPVESLPNIQLVDSSDSRTLLRLIKCVQRRVKTFRSTKEQHDVIQKYFRMNLSKMASTDRELEVKVKESCMKLSKKDKEVDKLERQVRKLESKNQVLTRTTEAFEKDKQLLREQLDEAKLKAKSSESDLVKVRAQMNGKVANTRALYEKQCEQRVRNARSALQEEMWLKEEKLRQLKNVVEARDTRHHRRRDVTPRNRSKPTPRPTPRTPGLTPRDSNRSQITTPRSMTTTTSASTTNTRRSKSHEPSDVTTKVKTASSASKSKRVDISGIDQPPIAKHRRSASTSRGNWLAHLPETTIPTETIFQANLKPQKIVNVPAAKDIANANRYVLTHQKEGCSGEIETHLYKGEVFQTRTGGQQVQFVDVETLAQEDPKDTEETHRKRKSVEACGDYDEEQSSWTDVETRCAYGLKNTSLTAAKKVKK